MYCFDGYVSICLCVVVTADVHPVPRRASAAAGSVADLGRVEAELCVLASSHQIPASLHHSAAFLHHTGALPHHTTSLHHTTGQKRGGLLKLAGAVPHPVPKGPEANETGRRWKSWSRRQTG